MTFLPSNAAERSALLWFLLGGLFQSLMSPTTWLIGPFRLVCFLCATASQESAYNDDARGDSGASWGLAQFGASTASMLGWTQGDALDPWKAGRMSVDLIAHAVRNRPQRWVFLYVPVIGYPLLRQLWTHGYGTDAGFTDACLWCGGSTVDESRGLATFAATRAATLLVESLLFVPVYLLLVRRKGRR